MSITDPLYPGQWHFDLIGDIETVWRDYSGAGVSVGVYDDGVERGHEDLRANYDASRHVRGDDGQPNSDALNHGTAVAGIIGAARNGVGGIGVAWEASITGVDFLQDLQGNVGTYQRALEHAARFDIANNSWGVVPDFAYSLGDTVDHAAFVTAVTEGRGGLGTILVKATGNEDANSQGDTGNVSHTTIVVGATDRSGEIREYSNHGANLLISAPTASDTTTTGNAYTDRFGGSSAATPVVSGVVALMLEANPDLGYRDVMAILAASAAQTGSAFGGPSEGYEYGGWFDNGASNWNGGGASYSLSYGFGAVDAFAATRMAEIWSVLSPTPATEVNRVVETVEYRGSAIAVPDLGSREASLRTDRDLTIEHVYVTVTSSHSWVGDIRLSLVAPDGTAFDLYDGEYGDGVSLSYGTQTFAVAGLAGVSSAGNWTLRYEDLAAGNSGTLHDFSIEFIGTASSRDDIYHYTADFLDLADVDRSRAILRDDDGGTDWINMSAIDGDVDLDLGAGAVAVDGRAWYAIEDAAIEAAITGDGDDRLAGTNRADHLMGQRGRDVILGGAGADTIDGGAGADVVTYARSGAGVAIDLLFKTAAGGFADGDVLRRVETVIGSDRGDDLRGSHRNDTLDGGGGDDFIAGRNGSDTIKTRGGNDSILGGGGDDRIYSGAGDDVMNGQAGRDRLDGGRGNDRLVGGDGHDTLIGGGGARDRLIDGRGNDLLVDSAASSVLFGGADDDRLLGRGGQDRLLGWNGDDRLEGGGGHDTLAGHAGDDVLIGGRGSDVFLFTAGGGHDRAEDFTPGTDRLLIEAANVGGERDADVVIATYAELRHGDAVFSFDDGGSATLLGIVDLAALADDLLITG